MANEDMIRRQMEQTRTSLSEKLETLETQVVDTVQGAVSTVQGAVDTVQGATAAVTDTVANIKDSVQETVSTVKDSVEGTVSAVKDTMAEGVAAVKEYVDIRGYVESYPWMSLGVSIAAGFCLGSFFGPKRQEPFKAEELARASNGHRGQHAARNGGQHSRKREAAASWLGEFTPEISKLKGLALGALLGTAREMITRSVKGGIGERLAEVIDNVTGKLGGEPVSHSDWEALQSSEEREGVAAQRGPERFGR